MKNQRAQFVIVIILLIGLVGHNIYLQLRLEEAIKASNYAAAEASDASSYARQASSYASDASDYAEQAADNAENAYYSAENASNAAFANQCWRCP